MQHNFKLDQTNFKTQAENVHISIKFGTLTILLGYFYKYVESRPQRKNLSYQKIF